MKTRTLLAFFAIYVIWGSTFLAVRIAVETMPPWFTAGARFLIAGTVLYAWMRFRGHAPPNAGQWRRLAGLALSMFALNYGALFWAEQYISSGIAAVLQASLPLITMLLEVFLFRKRQLQGMFLFAAAIGFGGILLLLWKGDAVPLQIFPCVVVLIGATGWALGSVLTRSLDLPESRGMIAGAEMMLGGAMLLVLSVCTGELRSVPHPTVPGLLALIYLSVAGSLIGFTAFVWLLARVPASTVSSHAYFNPLVAVALGYFAAGEPVTMRTMMASLLIVLSIVLILRSQQQERKPS